jgi:hypothetical protein
LLAASRPPRPPQVGGGSIQCWLLCFPSTQIRPALSSRDSFCEWSNSSKLLRTPEFYSLAPTVLTRPESHAIPDARMMKKQRLPVSLKDWEYIVHQRRRQQLRRLHAELSQLLCLANQVAAPIRKLTVGIVECTLCLLQSITQRIHILDEPHEFVVELGSSLRDLQSSSRKVLLLFCSAGDRRGWRMAIVQNW